MNYLHPISVSRRAGGSRFGLVHLLALLVGLLVVSACTVPQVDIPSQPGPVAGTGDDIRTLYVGPELVECTGVGPMECLQVRESPDEPYSLFYDSIEGFDFAPGFLYELRVQVEEVDDPPADASSLRYTLVEVVSQTAAADFPLEGTVWLLMQIVDPQTGDLESAIADSDGFILLDNGELGGNSGCNSFFGDYALEDDRLVFGMIGSTLMACPEPLMEQEMAFLAALESVTNYRLLGNTLTLLDETGATVAVFAESLGAELPEPDPATDPADEPDLDAPESEAALEGTRWELVEYAANGEMRAAVEEAGAFILLENNDASGHTGCNQFGGARAYVLEGESLRFGQLVSTLMACLGPEGEQEPFVFAGLEATRSYELENDTLTLLDEDGQPVLVFVRGETDAGVVAEGIEGVQWILVEYAADGELQAATADSQAFLILSEGNVTGSTGCNRFGGENGYVLEGTSLSFGELYATEMACMGPAGEQERYVFEALNATQSYTLEGDRLTLLDGEGAPLLVYVADSTPPARATGDMDMPVSNSQGADEGATVASNGSPALEGFLWTLVSYRSRGGEMVTPVAQSDLKLAEGNLSGSTGCNQMNGPYTTDGPGVDGNGLSFGMIATTRMGCAPDIAAQEFTVLDVLRQVADYGLENDTLTLVDAAGETLAVYEAR